MKTEYHHGNLALAAVSAGTTLALEKGLENLSLREIAAKCGVVPSSIYKHFENKEEMISAISAHSREILAGRMLESIQGVQDSTPQLRMRAAGAAYIQFAIDQPGHFQIAFKRPDFEADEANQRSPWGILNHLASEMKNSYALTDKESDLNKIFAWSSVHGLAELIASNALPDSVDLHETINHTLDSILESFEHLSRG